MTIRSEFLSELFSVFYDPDKHPGCELVTYTPHGGQALPGIPARIRHGQGDEYQGANSYGVSATMSVMASDIPTVTNKDTVTIGTETWGVIGAQKSSNGLQWEIQINKEES